MAAAVTRHTLGRALRATDYRKLSARPRHRGQKREDIAIYKWASLPARRWAKRGTRPSAPRDLSR